MSAIITTGDDAAIPVQLNKNGVPFAIAGDAVIKAVIVSLDRQTVLSEVVTMNNVAPGADLPNSLVIVEFSEAQTSAISALGEALLEIQVDDGGKLTWSPEVLIRKGNIA